MKTKLTFCILRPRILPLLFLFCTASVAVCAVAHAVPMREITVGTRWPQLIATNGKVFRNVKFTFVSPREVRFMHTDGIGSLPLREVVMPDDVSVPMLGAGDSGLPLELTMGPLGSMMTPQERKVSGIDKLSNDEQATLAKWVVGTVEERLKEELQRRGLPPTFAPLSSVVDSAASAAPGMLAMASDAATAAAADREYSVPGSAVLAATPRLMTNAPGRTYVPPFTTVSGRTPLLPPAGGKQGKARIGLVESSIAGEFSGLETGRQFHLVNGQTWVQQESLVHEHLAFKPRVTIYPANSGEGWMMAVDGVDKAVRVAPLN